jgi:hypothetical protein
MVLPDWMKNNWKWLIGAIAIPIIASIVVPIYFSKSSNLPVVVNQTLNTNGDNNTSTQISNSPGATVNINKTNPEERIEEKFKNHLQFVPVSKLPFNDIGLEEDERINAYGNDGDFILVANVIAKFNDETLNLEKFHKSINILSVLDVTNERASILSVNAILNILTETQNITGSYVCRHSIVTNTNIKNQDAYKHNSINFIKTPPGNIKASTWALYLRFRKCPNPNDIVEIFTGPVRWKVIIGKHEWIEFSKEKLDSTDTKWWASKATLHLELANLDWPIISSMRFINGVKLSEDILEIVIENHSEKPISLNSLIFTAINQKTIKETDLPAFMGPQWQQLSINWEKMKELDNEVKTVAAWTKLGNEKVLATAKYLNGSLSSRFRVNIPIQIDLAPNEIKRLAVKISEKIPPKGSNSIYDTLGEKDKLPISKWDELYITFEPYNTVFPEMFKLRNLSTDSPVIEPLEYTMQEERSGSEPN